MAHTDDIATDASITSDVTGRTYARHRVGGRWFSQSPQHSKDEWAVLLDKELQHFLDRIEAAEVPA